MLVLLVGVAFVVGVGLVLAAYVGATRVPGVLMQRKLETRLQEISQAPDERGAPIDDDLLKAQASGPLPALDRLLRGSAGDPPWAAGSSRPASAPRSVPSCSRP